MKKRIRIFCTTLMLSSFLMTLTGCDMKLPPMPWDPPAKPAEVDKAGAHGEEVEGEAEEAAPLDPKALLPGPMKTLPYAEVTIPMPDRLGIYGRLYAPGMKPATDEESADAPAESEGEDYHGPKYPLVILLHGLNRDHGAWNTLPATLVQAGYAVFAMDLRGHGKSTRGGGKKRVTWRLFKPEQWKQVPKDVGQVLLYFQKGEDYPQVDGKHAALVGEMLGANVAAYAGRNYKDSVKALVLVSPGGEYKGLQASTALEEYDHPILLMTSQNNEYSKKSTFRLYNSILGVKTLLEYGRIGDGAEMIAEKPAVGNAIAEWLANILTPVPGASSITPVLEDYEKLESVNGEVTPSGESTPAAHSSSPHAASAPATASTQEAHAVAPAAHASPSPAKHPEAKTPQAPAHASSAPSHH